MAQKKKNRNAILPQLVSVYEVTSPEKNDTEIISNLGSIVFFSRAHFVRQCRGLNSFQLKLGLNKMLFRLAIGVSNNSLKGIG